LTEERLRIALQVITRGSRAKIPDELRKRLFGPAPEKVMEEVRQSARKWVGSRSVQALGVGDKTVNGVRQEQPAIIVYVDRKRPGEKLRNRVPRTLRIPGFDPICTDVVAIGRVEPHSFPDHVRPAMPGCSIGHHAMVNMGTFGLLVRKQNKPRGSLYILSNSHVIARDGSGAKGDKVIQPGPGDVSGAVGTIGKLHEWVPYQFGSTAPFENLVDAAIARVIKKRSVTDKIRIVDKPPAGVSFEIAKGMSVYKVGSSTDYATAKVIDPHADVKLSFANGEVEFHDQVMCEPYALPGDSGSAVLNMNNEVVGLHFAGSPSACYFNRIEHVFRLLDITLA
jgi:hypothetical protein